MPLQRAHAGKHRIVVDAGVVDQHLDRARPPAPARAPPGRRRASVTSKRSTCAHSRAALSSCASACDALAAAMRMQIQLKCPIAPGGAQIAAPMPPLAPVTSARRAVVAHGSSASMRRRAAGCAALRQQALAAALMRNSYSAPRVIAVLTLGADQQIRGDIVQARDQQFDAARAGEHADRAAAARRRRLHAARRGPPWPAPRIRSRRQPRAGRGRAADYRARDGVLLAGIRCCCRPRTAPRSSRHMRP